MGSYGDSMRTVKRVIGSCIVSLIMSILISPFLMTYLLSIENEEIVDKHFIIIQLIIFILNMIVLYKLNIGGDENE